MDSPKKIVAKYEIGYTQFLDPSGKLNYPLPLSLQENPLLIEMYQAMVRTRVFDAKAILLQRTGQLGTYPSILGQEAIGVGIGAAMDEHDVFCPYYRDLGTQFWRGVKMAEILLYWGGDERGSCFANNPQDFPICVPVASQTLHAVGVATAFKLRNEARAVVTTIGDGGTSRGDFYESLNVAGVWQLPLVLVINNNQWAISVPRNKQTFTATLAEKGIAAGILGQQVDGNDVIAVFHAVQEGIQRAKQGGGPSLIEAMSYRMSDHTTADDAKRYRLASEVEAHRLEDPIARLKHYLMSGQKWNETDETNLQEKAKAEVDNAVEEYLRIEPNAPSVMFDSLYATLPRALESQRQEVLHGIKSKNE